MPPRLIPDCSCVPSFATLLGYERFSVESCLPSRSSARKFSASDEQTKGFLHTGNNAQSGTKSAADQNDHADRLVLPLPWDMRQAQNLLHRRKDLQDGACRSVSAGSEGQKVNVVHAAN